MNAVVRQFHNSVVCLEFMSARNGGCSVQNCRVPVRVLRAFLSAVAKLQTASVSFVMTICPSTWNTSAVTRGFS